MRLPNMAVFHTIGAAVMAMIVRLARRMNFTRQPAVAEAPDLNRVADLSPTNSPRVFWPPSTAANSQAEELAEVDLILRTATILQQAGIEFPPDVADFGEKAAEADPI